MADPAGFIHHLPGIKRPSARLAARLCPWTKLWGGMGGNEVVTRTGTAVSCQGPASPCSQHLVLTAGGLTPDHPWGSRAQGEQTLYSSPECRGREGRWSGLGEGRQCGMAGTKGGSSQGLPDHVQQRSRPLLQLWGALVLLEGLVPTLLDEVSGSLCERRGGETWLAAT